MKKMSKYLMFLFLLIIYIGRVYIVNDNHKSIPIVNHSIKEEVVYKEGKLITQESTPIGYSLQIEKGELKKKEDVLKEFNLTTKDIKNEYGLTEIPYFYVVKANVKNNNKITSEEVGINVRTLILQYKCGYIMQNEEIFKKINSHLPGIGFSILPNDTKEMTMIYPVYDMYKDIMVKVMQDDHIYLVLNVKPELNRIQLQ